MINEKYEILIELAGNMKTRHTVRVCTEGKSCTRQ